MPEGGEQPKPEEGSADSQPRTNEDRIVDALVKTGLSSTESRKLVQLERQRDEELAFAEAEQREWDEKPPQERFEALAKQLGFRARQEVLRPNPDGTQTPLVSYEAGIIASEEAGQLAALRMQAAAAGMQEAMSPLILPYHGIESGYLRARTGEGYERMEPGTYIQLVYEKPTDTPGATHEPQR
ncbi:hypothetical protein ACGF07_26090 [Kitasatospora sp. NPDC048194]|uniref:hypothetical protein n=1 Tax=Kitasatospora sp. NPDC048194 TaxID=3364045 RepID=UPI003722B326